MINNYPNMMDLLYSIHIFYNNTEFTYARPVRRAYAAPAGNTDLAGGTGTPGSLNLIIADSMNRECTYVRQKRAFWAAPAGKNDPIHSTGTRIVLNA